MRIVFSDHAEMRRKRKGFTAIEIEYFIEIPEFKRKRLDGIIEVIGRIRNRRLKILYVKEENYINVVSIIDIK